jgi:hypothetical protein
MIPAAEGETRTTSQLRFYERDAAHAHGLDLSDDELRRLDSVEAAS